MLKQSMSQFHLRKRIPGQPYIPPEKKNDQRFIEEARHNYEEALKKGTDA